MTCYGTAANGQWSTQSFGLPWKHSSFLKRNLLVSFLLLQQILVQRTSFWMSNGTWTTAHGQEFPPGWNDPKPDLFKSKKELDDVETAVVDTSRVLNDLKVLLDSCRVKVSQPGADSTHTRMMDDADKKIGPLIDSLGSGTQVAGLAELKTFLTGLSHRCSLFFSDSEAMSANDEALCTKTIATLMTKVFSQDSANNQWIPGLKRLLELKKQLP